MAYILYFNFVHEQYNIFFLISEFHLLYYFSSLLLSRLSKYYVFLNVSPVKILCFLNRCLVFQNIMFFNRCLAFQNIMFP